MFNLLSNVFYSQNWAIIKTCEYITKTKIFPKRICCTSITASLNNNCKECLIDFNERLNFKQISEESLYNADSANTNIQRLLLDLQSSKEELDQTCNSFSYTINDIMQNNYDPTIEFILNRLFISSVERYEHTRVFQQPKNITEYVSFYAKIVKYAFTRNKSLMLKGLFGTCTCISFAAMSICTNIIATTLRLNFLLRKEIKSIICIYPFYCKTKEQFNNVYTLGLTPDVGVTSMLCGYLNDTERLQWINEIQPKATPCALLGYSFQSYSVACKNIVGKVVKYGFNKLYDHLTKYRKTTKNDMQKYLKDIRWITCLKQDDFTNDFSTCIRMFMLFFKKTLIKSAFEDDTMIQQLVYASESDVKFTETETQIITKNIKNDLNSRFQQIESVSNVHSYIVNAVITDNTTQSVYIKSLLSEDELLEFKTKYSKHKKDFSKYIEKNTILDRDIASILYDYI